MDLSINLELSGIVPVVVLEDASHAVPTARALLRGGIRVMEITFRTAAAADSIRAVAEQCPEMTVGAGTVITLAQCRQAVECGAKFIVSPGFDPEIVSWCVEHEITVTPGCVTPTEIMAAMKLGLRIVKFFPANVYGGLTALKSLSAPFPSMRFIPTGGVNASNLGEFAAASCVYAIGGSWVCTKADISAGNYEKITMLCREAREKLLGFVASDSTLAARITDATGMPVLTENSEEKLPTLRTNTMLCALPVLTSHGCLLNRASPVISGGRMVDAVFTDPSGKLFRVKQK